MLGINLGFLTIVNNSEDKRPVKCARVRCVRNCPFRLSGEEIKSAREILDPRPGSISIFRSDQRFRNR